jgi:predicted dehydrogenase
MDRREFVRGATGAAVGMTAASWSRVLGANDRINLALVGCGGRGEYVMKNCLLDPAVEVVALCDVWDERVAERKAVVPGAEGYADHRALLDRSDVDAVIVATPDHWHTDITIDAMEAGKDVFVEKPMTFRREEGPRIVEAVERTGRICQVGTQQRSGEFWMKARDEYVQPGRLGRIHMVRTCWHSTWWDPEGMQPPRMEKPADLDWERWLGQVSWREWNPYQYFNYRAFLDFGGGKITDLFTHWIDAVHMIMGVDNPVSFTSAGGVFQYSDGRDAPDNIHLLVEYPDDFVVTFESTCLPGTPPWGITFYGTEGTLFINRESFEVRPNEEGAEPLEVELSQRKLDQSHSANFLECLRTRQQPNCTASMGHRSAQASILATRAYTGGRTVRFDPVKEDVLEA